MVSVDLQCILRDGSMTNYVCKDRADPAHVDQIWIVRLPAETREVRLRKAEGHLGSFQDVWLPFGIELPSLNGGFNYKITRFPEQLSGLRVEERK